MLSFLSRVYIRIGIHGYFKNGNIDVYYWLDDGLPKVKMEWLYHQCFESESLLCDGIMMSDYSRCAGHWILLSLGVPWMPRASVVWAWGRVVFWGGSIITCQSLSPAKVVSGWWSTDLVLSQMYYWAIHFVGRLEWRKLDWSTQEYGI